MSGRQRSLLPDFPSIRDGSVACGVDPGMMETFLVMYKTHCQRILDSVIRANFDEVHTLLFHFWQGIPCHLHPLITCHSFVHVVCACDGILYKSIASFMLTSTTQSTIPENLARLLRKFTSSFDSSMRQAMGHSMPERLKQAKVDLARKFSNLIKRQLSISRLTSAVRMITSNGDLLMQMFIDWHSIDHESVISETTSCFQSQPSPPTSFAGSPVEADVASSGYSNPGFMSHSAHLVRQQVMRNACEEFMKLLEHEPPLESYFEWLEGMIHKCVLHVSA